MNYSKINNLIILDTNVIISAQLSKHPDSATKQVYGYATNGNKTPLYSKQILNEYIKVLYYPKFKFDKKIIKKVLSEICQNGIKITPTPSQTKLSDQKDQPFYDLVTTKSAGTPILITGNLKHFPETPFILSPRQYLLTTKA